MSKKILTSELNILLKHQRFLSFEKIFDIMAPIKYTATSSKLITCLVNSKS